MASRFDDELWELVPLERGAPPAATVDFVAGLGPVPAALDLGCGDGLLTEALLAERLVAADVSAVALRRARDRLGSRAEAVELEPDYPLPFGDGEFDLVLIADTLEHVRDVQLVLSEARRVLRPAGELAIATPAHGRLTGLRIALSGFERVFPPLSPHLRFFSRRSLGGLLDQLGFDVRSIERGDGVLYARATR